MIFVVKKLVKPAFCLTVFVYSNTVDEQISLVQNLIDKVESYKSFGYQSINKLKDMSADTTVAQNKELYLKKPHDKLYGYLNSIETNHTTENFHRIDLYDGEGLMVLSPEDSTFFPEKAPYIGGSVIGGLKLLNERYAKSPFKITMLKDTINNGAANSHLVANVNDTLDINEHLHSTRHYYIDKQQAYPVCIP